jgi:hypothetical protein
MGASVIAPGPTVPSSLKFDHPDYEPVVGSSATSAARGFRCTPGAAAARLSVPACLDTTRQGAAMPSRPMLPKGEQLHQRGEFAGPLLAAGNQGRDVPGCGVQQVEPDMHSGAAPGSADACSSAWDAAAISGSGSITRQLSGPRPGRHDAGRTSAEHLHSPRVCLYITEVGCATVTRQWPWQAAPSTCSCAHPAVALPARSNSMPNLPSPASSHCPPLHALQEGSLHDQLPGTYRRAYTNCPLAFDPFEGDLALLDSPLVQALMFNAL